MKIAANTHNNSLFFKKRNKNIISLDKLNKTPMSKGAKLKLTGLIAAAAMSIGSLGVNKNMQASLSKYLAGNMQTESILNSVSSKPKSEQLKFAQKQIRRAIKRCETLQDEIWNNFSQIHSKTQDLDGRFNYKYYNHLDYQNLYNNEYTAITSIKTGKKPWKNIQTEEEAIQFINSILKEASSHTNSSHIEITGGANITKGELALINRTLNRLENANPEIQNVTKIYKKEIKKAKRETQKQSTQTNFEKKFQNDTSEAVNFQQEDLRNIDKIDAQSKKIEKTKKAYEARKEEFSKTNSLTPRQAVDFIVAYQDYLHANIEMLSICNLNPSSKTLNPSTAISGLDINQAIEKIQKKLDKKI